LKVSYIHQPRFKNTIKTTLISKEKQNNKYDSDEKSASLDLTSKKVKDIYNCLHKLKMESAQKIDKKINS
jgi:hypothetical protein